MRIMRSPHSDRHPERGTRLSPIRAGMVVAAVLLGSLLVAPAVSASASVPQTGSASATQPDETKFKIFGVSPDETKFKIFSVSPDETKLKIRSVAGSPAAVTPDGFLGQCHGNFTAGPVGAFAGWCDGNGPNSYRAHVVCATGRQWVGSWRWDGDRRGSTAVCNDGSRATSGFFDFAAST